MKAFVLSTLLLLAVSLTALASPPSIVLVQYRSEPGESKLTITRGVKQSKVYAAKSMGDSDWDLANMEQLQVMFTGLYGEGYTLQNSTVVVDGSVHLTTYVFVKP
jgi:hypothetical protein